MTTLSGKSFVDVVVGEVALFLGEPNEFFDFLREFGSDVTVGLRTGSHGDGRMAVASGGMSGRGGGGGAGFGNYGEVWLKLS